MNHDQHHRAVTSAAIVATFAFCAWQLTKGNGAPLARLSSPSTQLALRMVAVCLASSIAVAVGVTRAEFQAPPCSYEPCGPMHPPSDELSNTFVQTGAFDRREWQVQPKDSLRRYQNLKFVYQDTPARLVLAILVSKIIKAAVAANLQSVVVSNAVGLLLDVNVVYGRTSTATSPAPSDAATDEVSVTDSMLEEALGELDALAESQLRATPDSVLDGESLPVTPDVHHGVLGRSARSSVTAPVDRIESFTRGRSPTWISNHSFDTPPPQALTTFAASTAARNTKSHHAYPSGAFPARVSIFATAASAEAADVLLLPSLRPDCDGHHIAATGTHSKLMAPLPAAKKAQPATVAGNAAAGHSTTTTTIKPTRPFALTRAQYAADPTIKRAYRHDPYSNRAFARLDSVPARRDSLTLGITRRGSDAVDDLEIPMELLFKANTPALSIRPRLSTTGGCGMSSVCGPAKTSVGSGSDRTDNFNASVSLMTPKTNSAAMTPKTLSGRAPTSNIMLPPAMLSPLSAPLPAATVVGTPMLPMHQYPPTPKAAAAAPLSPVANEQAVARQAKISAARKNMKKTYDSSGMALSQPFFGINIAVAAADAPKIDAAEDATAPVRLAAPLLFEHGQVTMTGLPNIDGHRVAMALLRRLAELRVIRGNFELATAERRTDRFNTGACHITLERVEDARRLYDVLNRMSLFADLRGSDIVVAPAAM